MWKRLNSLSSSVKHARLSDVGFRVWTCLLPHTDRAGRFTAEPRDIKSKCMPFHGLCTADIGEALDEMETGLEFGPLIHRWKQDGKPYLVLHDHAEHNPEHLIRHHAIKYPTPVGISCKCLQATARMSDIGRDSQPVADYAVQTRRRDVTGRDVTGRTELKKDTDTAVPPSNGIGEGLPTPEPQEIELYRDYMSILSGKHNPVLNGAEMGMLVNWKETERVLLKNHKKGEQFPMSLMESLQHCLEHQWRPHMVEKLIRLEADPNKVPKHGHAKS